MGHVSNMGRDLKNWVLGKKYHEFCEDKDELSGYRESVRLLTCSICFHGKMEELRVTSQSNFCLCISVISHYSLKNITAV